jgi:uncharacterized membrane protein YfcA
MHFDPLVSLAGLIVGFAVGLTGMGGGALMTPVLVLLFHVQPLAAVSSDLVASLIMKPVGAAVHASRRTVYWPLAVWLAVGSIPSAFFGVLFLRLIGHGRNVQSVVAVALGAVLLVAVAAIGLKWALEHRQLRRAGPLPASDDNPQVRRARTWAIGTLVGFIVGITSVGSGSLAIVLLLFLYPRLRGSRLVGTDLVQAIPMVGSAAVAHILFGDFKIGLTLSIISGSIPGVLLGATLSSRARTGLIRAALAVVLLASGLKLVNVPTVGVGVALVVAIAVIGVGVFAVAPALRARFQESALPAAAETSG